MTMRRCSKCQQLVADEDWGTQRYCKPCWGKYNRSRKAIAKERDRLQDLYDAYWQHPTLGPKVKAQLEALSKPAPKIGPPDLPPSIL